MAPVTTQTVLQQAVSYEQVEREVEVPSINVSHEQELVPQAIQREVIVEVPTIHEVELIRETAVVQDNQVVKVVELPKYVAVQRSVEKQVVLNEDTCVEVPHVQLVDLVKQIPREVTVERPVRVEKPVISLETREVLVPAVSTLERIVERPVEHIVELVRERVGAVESISQEKLVPKIEVECRVLEEAVPLVETQPQVVEVSEVNEVSYIKQVPKVEVQFVDKHVEVPQMQYVEKVVEIPTVIMQERIVEVPEVETREIIREVPVAVIQYKDKEVRKPTIIPVERLVEKAVELAVERPVNVPQVQAVEIIREIPVAEYSHVQKEVKSVSLEVNRKIVEVPQAIKEDRIVEVDQLQVVELRKEIAKPTTEIIEKTIIRPDVQEVEKVIGVPRNLVNEVMVEVPQTQQVECMRQEIVASTQEVLKEVPLYEMKYLEKMEEVNHQLVVDGGERRTSAFAERSVHTDALQYGSRSILLPQPVSTSLRTSTISTPVFEGGYRMQQFTNGAFVTSQNFATSQVAETRNNTIVEKTDHADGAVVDLKQSISSSDDFKALHMEPTIHRAAPPSAVPMSNTIIVGRSVVAGEQLPLNSSVYRQSQNIPIMTPVGHGAMYATHFGPTTPIASSAVAAANNVQQANMVTGMVFPQSSAVAAANNVQQANMVTGMVFPQQAPAQAAVYTAPSVHIGNPVPMQYGYSPTTVDQRVSQRVGNITQFGGNVNFKSGSITETLFDSIDRNHDGSITREEFKAALNSNVISGCYNRMSALASRP